MTATVITFTSGLSTNVAAIPATGSWFAMDRSIATGRAFFEILAFTGKWVPLTGDDGQGKTFVYELTDRNPSVRILGPIDVSTIRINAANIKGTTTNAITQYT